MTNLITSALIADQGGRHMSGWDGLGWMWIVGTVIVVGIAVAVLIAGIVNRNNEVRHRDPAPRDVLASRYAHGEISTEEYHERLDGLR